jgi:hypothetical protein
MGYFKKTALWIREFGGRGHNRWCAILGKVTMGILADGVIFEKTPAGSKATVIQTSRERN